MPYRMRPIGPLVKLLHALVLSLGLSTAGSADVLVLVHGFAADPGTWDFSGVNRVLDAHGWLPGPAPAGGNSRYSVALPASAPLGVQTTFLQSYLAQIRAAHPGEKLAVAGHSAGGVVARLALLNGNAAGVATLITIASPHLGTPRAVQGLEVVNDKPFFCPGPGYDFLKDMFGGGGYHFLRYSEGVMIDLLPVGSGNVLAWANTYPHPDIEYHAVVREGGDYMVPAYSQDLNQVPALAGRATLWLTRGPHELSPADGELLARILE